MSRILVADDDADIARFVELNLQMVGFDVEVVHDGAVALERAQADPPDLVLLDVMMPTLDGVEVLRRLRSHAATSVVPVILLTAKALSADKVVGLTAGADDYIVKPFDTLELVARVRTTLRRTEEARATSPLTGLPGNHSIDREIASRSATGLPYAVCHVDLDDFKAFNDSYGFLRGDDLLHLLARCLLTAVAATGEPTAFLGHVGGDDFVVVCTPDQAEPLCRLALAEFDAAVLSHYDPADAARGWLESTDRRGELRRHPVVAVSVGVARHDGSPRDHRSVVAVAAEMKLVAKSTPGSGIALDRRVT